MATTTSNYWGAHLFEASFVNLARRIREGTGIDHLRVALDLLRSRGYVVHLQGEPHSKTASNGLNGTRE